jgi:NAD(P)-dependent dehydrogenase (short-subunit alcohol dehydrogenase family)
MGISVVVRQPASSAIINPGTRVYMASKGGGRRISEAGGSENGALAGQVALVTGASSGLGKATAFALARAGADVALAARSREELESTKEEVSNTGRRVLSLTVDLASEGEPVEVVERTVETLGRIDVLVNAAGTDAPGTVEELDVEGWDRTLAVNLRAPFLLCKAAFPHMREAGGGTIVNISSVAGRKGWANASAYCASKFGLTGFTEALADEGKEHGIRAIVLYPGAMATNWGAFSPEECRESEPKEAPRTRILAPERVAELIAWLAASPPEFVLTEGVVLPLEEGLP